MSSKTRRPDPAFAIRHGGDAAVLVTGLRVVLALLYPLIAHLAVIQGDHRLAALAVGDIVLVVLLDGLRAGKRRHWLWLLFAVPGLVLLSRTEFAMLPLLIMPAVLLAIVALGFARTLRAGKIPLIARIVEALEGDDAGNLPEALRRYARGLTLAWAMLLGSLALVNLTLALCALPGGVLASLGIAPPLAVTDAQWSWFANIFNYGIVGLFFVAEYSVRRLRFPERAHGFRHFITRLAKMGPSFWRSALH